MECFGGMHIRKPYLAGTARNPGWESERQILVGQKLTPPALTALSELQCDAALALLASCKGWVK